MKTVFADTNVLIDFLADRRPFSLQAAEIFEAAIAGKVKIYVSAVSYNNIYYILRQSVQHAQATKLLEQLFEMTEIVDVSKSVIRESLQSDFRDFEDAIQYYCALSVKRIDCIVTRNARDFRNSQIPVLSPLEAVKSIGS